jgi:hypothetical protein
MAFSPDGQLLASASDDKTVKLWDASTGRDVRTLTGHTGLVVQAVFSPDGRFVASASADMTVKLWDLKDLQEPVTLYGHTATVMDVAFSPEGQRLATGGGDGIVKVWDVPTRQEILTLRGHTDNIWAVAFSPDGQRLASGAEDETVKVWEALPRTRELRLQREAAALVNRLAAEPLVKEEVTAALRREADLSDPVRQQALEMVARYREDPPRFCQASWAVVQKPGAAEAKYQLALRQAEAACGLATPQDAQYGFYLTALGAARYRVGQNREALDSLKRADTLFSAQIEGGVYFNLAFLAMTHHRLGKQAEAQAVLARLLETMKSPQLANNNGPQALVREARELIEGKAPESKK